MRSRFFAVLVLSLAAVLVFAPASAFGWNNGPDGADSFGTHDWIVYKATQAAAERGVTWVDVNVAMAASDDPDTLFHDEVYHHFDATLPDVYGDSPSKVEECYYIAVSSLKAGDTRTASYCVGLISHYLSDSRNPLHTEDSAAESSMHAAYERDVDTMFTSPGAMQDWGLVYGFDYTGDPSGFTIKAAAQANQGYTNLVNNYIAGGLYEPVHVGPLTRAGVQRSVADVSWIIRSISIDAVYTPQPNAVYRFFRPQTGTHLYSADWHETAEVIGHHGATYRFEGVAYFADPAVNSMPLYRFSNDKNGTHLYTADEAEKNRIRSTLSSLYHYEGVAYYVSLAGGTQVYRFYSPSKNTHFYSADPNEIAYVRAHLGAIWQYEGPAYCVAQ